MMCLSDVTRMWDKLGVLLMGVSALYFAGWNFVQVILQVVKLTIGILLVSAFLGGKNYKTIAIPLFVLSFAYLLSEWKEDVLDFLKLTSSESISMIAVAALAVGFILVCIQWLAQRDISKTDCWILGLLSVLCTSVIVGLSHFIYNQVCLEIGFGGKQYPRQSQLCSVMGQVVSIGQGFWERSLEFFLKSITNTIIKLY